MKTQVKELKAETISKSKALSEKDEKLKKALADIESLNNNFIEESALLEDALEDKNKQEEEMKMIKESSDKH